MTTKPPAPVSHISFTREYILSGVVIALCTAVALPLRPHLAPTNLVMVYFIGVLVIATRCSRRAAMLTSAISVAAFDFFCVPPYYTFAVAEYQYVITFGVMFVVAALISAMTARIRLQATAAVEREAQTNALYRLSNELAGHHRVFEIARAAARLAEDTFPLTITMFLPGEDGQISFSRRTSDQLYIPSTEQAIAQWVFEHGRNVGKGMSTLPGASALYIPLRTADRTFGVMAVIPDRTMAAALTSEQQHLLEVFASQTALAIERATAASAARTAEVRVETESMRTSLLSAVSHDLRTPLASITGAAATLRTHWNRLDDRTREELLQSVTDEADRLNRLLNNLLEVTRLESGVHLRKELFPLEEIVGAALHRLRRQLSERQVQTDIPAELPMVAIDNVLVEQVFINLIENALKYTPPDTAIEIAAYQGESVIEVEVRDSGPGFNPGDEDRVFDKFFRDRTDNVRGAGLGLAICRAIVEAHGGTIRAQNRRGGGAIIHFSIPMSDSTSAVQSGERSPL
jgi:two-component system sensor histidine kinase KdpD